MSKGAANAVTGQAHAVHYDTPNVDFAQVPTIRSFVQAQRARAGAIMSVCTGAGLLASCKK